MPTTLRIPCPSCHGDGYHVSVGAPGRFDPAEESFLPAETLQRCQRCSGEGEIDGCPLCRQPLGLDLQLGCETCGCEADLLREAA